MTIYGSAHSNRWPFSTLPFQYPEKYIGLARLSRKELPRYFWYLILASSLLSFACHVKGYHEWSGVLMILNGLCVWHLTRLNHMNKLIGKHNKGEDEGLYELQRIR